MATNNIKVKSKKATLWLLKFIPGNSVLLEICDSWVERIYFSFGIGSWQTY